MCRGNGERMAGVGVAVEELHRMCRAGHERLLDVLTHNYAAERHGRVVDGLGEGGQIGLDAEKARRERCAQAAEAGDHFVKDQKDAVLGADLAQPLEVALGWTITPVEPCIGSTITAAIVEASCKATMRSSSSARCAPQSGCPRL